MNTLKEKSEGLFKERGSKFIAYAFPVENEEQIRTQLNLVKSEHTSARHHCYAYRLGESGEIWRANDDGEPSGTAGKPILGQLQSFELSNVLIIVVRYLGGVLLGKGGLIKAYRNVASSAISNGKITPLEIWINLNIEINDSDFHSFLKSLKKLEGKITDQQYDTKHKMSIQLNKKNLNSLKENFKEKMKITYDQP